MSGNGFENLSPHYQDIILAKVGGNQELVANSSYFFLHELLKQLCDGRSVRSKRSINIYQTWPRASFLNSLIVSIMRGDKDLDVEVIMYAPIERDIKISSMGEFMHIYGELMHESIGRYLEELPQDSASVIIVSSLIGTIGRYLEEVPQDRPPIERDIKVSSLDGNRKGREVLLSIYSYLAEAISKKDIEDWVDRFDERCLSGVNIQGHFRESDKGWDRPYITGELNIEDSFRDRYDNNGMLESEIRQDFLYTRGHVLDYRNQKWRTKIVEAHKINNSVFVAGGITHFIAQDRNPLNIPEMTEYLEANKDLPTNVLGMLEQEGFKIRRMNANCSFQ